MLIKIKNKAISVFVSIKCCFFSFLYPSKKFLNVELKHQPIFIIGAPRTGSTILYQALTNYFDVLYIDNLVDEYHKNIFYGFRKSINSFSGKPHNNFQAKFGSTSDFSEHAPSESGSFWYRWLPKDRHFISESEICQKSKDELYSEVCAVINTYNKPIIFKNLNAGQRLRFIKEVFPNARFIYIKRSHEKVITSILNARRANGIGEHHWWSVKPRDYEQLLNLPENEMVVEQICRIEAQIEQDLKLYTQCHTVNFNDLSQSEIAKIGDKWNLSLREGGSLPVFKKD